MKKITDYLGVFIIISLISLGFMSQFITYFEDPNLQYDGLGRQLYKAPFWAKYIGSGNTWSGLFWHAADTILLFGGIMISSALFKYGKNKKSIS